ncbi:MAG: GTP pyrophosphokinase family protein, partial [Ruminococcus sp.]|nr:GTP pyrophosphokinase family protein [Ruminococcus sp.]
ARKDYIASPKPNGYRSLHLIVSVPVFFAEEKRDMRVEVQIRTIAMDFWASLEHQLKYKQAVENEQEIVDRLRDCAEVIAGTDREMLSIRSEIEMAADIPSEDDILFEKIKNFDVPIY